MKTIIEKGKEALVGYEELKQYDQFIYKSVSGEFFAIKITDNYAAFINDRGKFILAKKYENCLSIGSGIVFEHRSLEEAIDFMPFDSQP